MQNKYKSINYKLMSGFLAMALMLSVSVSFAQKKISGKVTDGSNGESLPGASVSVKGTSTGAIVDGNGNYSISASNDANILVFSFIGFVTKEIAIGGQSTINVALESDAQALQEVVVTGYQQLRKKDITGAVTIVEADKIKSFKTTSFTQALAGQAAGVTVSSSGNPGDAVNIRVRGIGSFTSNDPLYIIDGVPVQDQYQNTINPDDIETIQILKDASASSIYGSRASNGVIVITTKKGKAGKTKVTYNGSYGIVNSVKGYDQILNQSSADYATAIRLKFANDPGSIPLYAQTAGSLPKYIQPQTNGDPGAYDILTNQISLTNQVGTNWWKEITRTAQMQDHAINLAGGTESATFNISASYLTQEGVIKFTDYNRGTIRANSQYKVGKSVRIGENLMFAGNWGVNANSTGGNSNEQGIIGNVLKATPIVPVFDINGNPGGHLTAGSGNFTNPTRKIEANKDNGNTYNRVLGNIYAEVDVIPGLTLKTLFGSDFGNGFSRQFTYPEPYRVEGNKTANGFGENWQQNFTWNWTNTANYIKSFGKHTVNVLAGQEAVSYKGRNIGGNLSNYFTTDVNAWYLNSALADPASRSVFSGGRASRLSSYFSKVDYSFDDRYLVSATIRRDGSSKFLSGVRYGVFPAVSLGWRVSQESFMKDLSWLTDMKIRASYGELGNQNIRDYNFTNLYGGSVGSTFYDINGTNSSAVTGYALTARGNANTIWESAKTTNFGVDLGLLNNSITVNLDVYNRNTSNLLFNPPVPGTAGSALAPFINVGSMENKGFDLALGYKKNLGQGVGLRTSMNLSRYKNKIIKVSNDDDKFFSDNGISGRLGENTAINKVGYAIGSFRGFVADGLITSEAEKSKQLAGSQIGGLKFKDISGPEGKPDGIINDDDITIIGSPHPNLTMGWNLGFTYKNFDLNAFTFGSFGNKIYNYIKVTNYFMNFNSNILKDQLSLQGTGNYPKINGSDLTSRRSSSFYVEDGTYVRLANLQLGYNIPKLVSDKLKLSSARIYIQGQNLLTFTKYSGVDPAVSNVNLGNNSANNDLRTGFDGGNYPQNKIMSLGVNLQF